MKITLSISAQHFVWLAVAIVLGMTIIQVGQLLLSILVCHLG
ncbi:hypothetical protein [Marinomonas foliarum]|nr:hypothetical protein [Marinomonas foliarum]